MAESATCSGPHRVPIDPLGDRNRGDWTARDDLFRLLASACQSGLFGQTTGAAETLDAQRAMLAVADRLNDLRVPPGNRLEALKGKRVGQYSIRVNDQFRVCFRWTEAGAEDVEIMDYH